MQQSGISETEIIRSLMKEGISPKEIKEALSQSKIKAAVYDETPGGMQPSLSPQKNGENVVTAPPKQEPAEYYPEPIQEGAPAVEADEQPYTQTSEQAYAGTGEQAYPQEYPAYEPYEQYEPMPQSISGDIVSEIAEQIVYEKIGQIKKQIESLQDMETNITLRLTDTEKRLERIENIIDTLQNSFIKKIGNYGQGLEDIKTEMQGMQETFTKMVDPLMDIKRGTQIVNKKRKSSSV